MIKNFRHKGLRRLFEEGDARAVPSRLARKLGNVLTLLNVATKPEEAAPFPGLRPHRLRGDMKGMWSVTVSGNWRVVFRFEGGDVFDIDFVDYH